MDVKRTLEDSHATAASALGALALTLARQRPASKAVLQRCVRQLREAADSIERIYTRNGGVRHD